MKKNTVHWIRFFSVVSFVFIFLLSHFSCKMTEEGFDIPDKDTEPPLISSFRVIDSRTVEITCSEPVLLSNLAVSGGCAEDKTEYNGVAACSSTATGAIISFSEPTLVGVPYSLHGVALDASGNSLEFSQSFRGFNENPARMVLSEIRVGASKKKVEYVEVYVVKSGNTSGLEIVSGNYGESKKYVFPAIEVKQGDFITVHMKTYDKEDQELQNCVDETGSNLAKATATDTNPASRDLWNSATKRSVASSDVLVLRNSAPMKLMDAILYTQSGSEPVWEKKLQQEFAEAAVSQGIWQGTSSPSSNCIADGITTAAAARSLSRQNIGMIKEHYTGDDAIIPASPTDWIVVKKVTPGALNSTDRFIAVKK